MTQRDPPPPSPSSGRAPTPGRTDSGDRRGDTSRPPKRGASVQEARPPTPAKKIRSPFGTRVARKITCSSCGAEDTIHFAPRAGQAPLCRRCAADRLGVVDRDANIAPEARKRCDRCGVYVVKPCTFDDPLDCPEHVRALALRQPDRSRTGIRSGKNVIRVRRSSEPST